MLVLILVVVEVGLGRLRVLGWVPFRLVLILVVVEVGLGRAHAGSEIKVALS